MEAYRSYILRIWQAGDDQGWHASLDRISGDTHQVFTSIEDLIVFLDSTYCDNEVLQVDQETEGTESPGGSSI